MTTPKQPSAPVNNKGGRPRTEAGSTVTVYLRAVDHDKLVRDAKIRDLSVSGLVRDLLKLKL